MWIPVWIKTVTSSKLWRGVEMMENLNFSISARTRLSKVDWKIVPSSNMHLWLLSRSKSIQAKKLSAERTDFEKILELFICWLFSIWRRAFSENITAPFLKCVKFVLLQECLKNSTRKRSRPNEVISLKNANFSVLELVIECRSY